TVAASWTLLIVPVLLSLGPRKYVAPAQSLQSTAPNVLSDRLKLLEANGIIAREFYEDHPPRARYKLTRRGADLRTVIQALLQWGSKHVYDGVTIVHEACGHDVKLKQVCDHCGETLEPRETKVKYRNRAAAAALGVPAK